MRSLAILFIVLLEYAVLLVNANMDEIDNTGMNFPGSN